MLTKFFSTSAQAAHVFFLTIEKGVENFKNFKKIECL